MKLRERHEFRYDVYAIATIIGYYTGLRASEAFALNKSDFDLTNNLIKIDKKLIYKGLRRDEYYVTKEMKSKKSKAMIPLADVLKDEIVKWFQENPYERVICDKYGNYMNPTCMTNYMKDLSSKYNIQFNYHMLRHSFATNIVMSDINIKTAQELMRHSNINTTISLYTHIDDEIKRQAINSVFPRKCVKNVLNSEKEK